MSYKKWYESTTIQLAIAQAVSGIVIAFITQFPELGWLMIAKSLIDIAIRILKTKNAVK